MIRKLNIYLTILLSCSPFFVFAAYNDVTLTTTNSFTVGSYTLNVTGSSVVVESITVNTNNITMTMRPGSYIQVTSPTANRLVDSITMFTQSNTCANGISVITLSSAGDSGIVSITPTSTLCNGTNSSGSSGSSSVGGNGPILGMFGTTTATSSLSTFADTAPSATPTAITNTGISFAGVSYGKNHSNTKVLQQILNLDPETQVSLSGPGSPRNETMLFGKATLTALKKFQVKYKITNSSRSDYGVFGPKTKAKLIEVANLKNFK